MGLKYNLGFIKDKMSELGITTVNLRETDLMSETSFQHIRKNENVNLKTLVNLCRAFQVELSDLVRYEPEEGDQEYRQSLINAVNKKEKSK